MAASEEHTQKLTFRKFADGEHQWDDFKDLIFNEDNSHKCPTYVHRTRLVREAARLARTFGDGSKLCVVWRNPRGGDLAEYAFRRATDANPFPAMMGRVCPVPRVKVVATAIMLTILSESIPSSSTSVTSLLTKDTALTTACGQQEDRHYWGRSCRVGRRIPIAAVGVRLDGV